MTKVLTASSIADKIIEIENKLTAKFNSESFVDKDVSTIYNPLEYAAEPHQNYIKKYCNTPKQVMFLGMNPGPFGMTQNGVPFGEINIVKDWLKITGIVNRPKKENPNRVIEGMNVKRSEVSGLRLWGMFKEISKEPEVFFKNCIVYNYIPLCFIGTSGKNIAPNLLKPNIRKKIITESNNALTQIIDVLQIKIIVAVGKWTEEHMHELKRNNKLPIVVKGIMHPSPLNPRANKNYIADVTKDLEKLDILKYLLPDENTFTGNLPEKKDSDDSELEE